MVTVNVAVIDNIYAKNKAIILSHATHNKDVSIRMRN